jgi:transglutaminase-like putative cysteine protease
VLSAPERERYLQSNAWLRLDDRKVRRFARRAGPSSTSAHVRMRRLEQMVAEQLPQIDMLGYQDAVTALESGRGDCTETAVLLVAAARAQGIPARIVAGLAYSDRFSGRRDVFAPHYWVQAWIEDRWVSYDAGLLGFDATHIALAFGDGDPAQTLEGMAQLGLLQIEQMGLLSKPGT